MAVWTGTWLVFQSLMVPCYSTGPFRWSSIIGHEMLRSTRLVIHTLTGILAVCSLAVQIELVMIHLITIIAAGHFLMEQGGIYDRVVCCAHVDDTTADDTTADDTNHV